MRWRTDGTGRKELGGVDASRPRGGEDCQSMVVPVGATGITVKDLLDNGNLIV